MLMRSAWRRRKSGKPLDASSNSGRPSSLAPLTTPSLLSCHVFVGFATRQLSFVTGTLIIRAASACNVERGGQSGMQWPAVSHPFYLQALRPVPRGDGGFQPFACRVRKAKRRGHC